MRFTLVPIILFVATACHGADQAIKASGTIDGQKVRFPAKGIAEGVKATIELLESCHDESLYQADELKKAEQADHLRLVFPKPITVEVMEEEVEVAELVFRLPLNTGVFWLRSGDKVRRYSKYEFQKSKPFMAWLREAQPEEPPQVPKDKPNLALVVNLRLPKDERFSKVQDLLNKVKARGATRLTLRVAKDGEGASAEVVAQPSTPSKNVAAVVAELLDGSVTKISVEIQK